MAYSGSDTIFSQKIIKKTVHCFFPLAGDAYLIGWCTGEWASYFFWNVQCYGLFHQVRVTTAGWLYSWNLEML